MPSIMKELNAKHVGPGRVQCVSHCGARERARNLKRLGASMVTAAVATITIPTPVDDTPTNNGHEETTHHG
jgi:hypothetical protein